jgi:hypothetical protein
MAWTFTKCVFKWNTEAFVSMNVEVKGARQLDGGAGGGRGALRYSPQHVWVCSLICTQSSQVRARAEFCPQSLWSRSSIAYHFTETEAPPAGRIRVHNRLRWKMASTAPKVCRLWPGIQISDETRHSVNGKHIVTWEVTISQSKKFLNLKLISYLAYFKTLIVADSSPYLLASNCRMTNKYHISSKY